MQIPKDAKKVFKGVVFDVYHWQQKMFDGSYKTFEMLKRPHSVEAVIVEGNKVCLSLQKQPGDKQFYTLIGGRSEGDESPEDAMKRELLEETGFECPGLELYKTYRLVDKIDWNIYLYIAKNCKAVARPNPDAGEIIELIKLEFEEFIQIVLSEKFRDTEFTFEIQKLMSENKLNDFKDRIFS
jgi:ADP-ribose pyrophosphatase